MASESNGTQTATPGTPHTLASPTTDVPRKLMVNITNLSGAETVTLTIKAKVLTGGTAIVAVSRTFAAGDPEPHTQSPYVEMPYGGVFVLQQNGGSSRTFEWNVVTAR